MAHSLSAKKRIRQNAKRRSRNHWRKGVIKSVRKEFEEAVVHGSPEQAAEKLRSLSSTLDHMSSKGAIHKNTASRRKSRAALALNKKAAKVTSPGA